jgi:hypothetical protein
LDPNNIELRIEFAELLRRRGEVAEARWQYQRALELNDALPPQEIRRLPAPRADEIRAILLNAS